MRGLRYAGVALLAGCVHAPPHIQGHPGASSAPARAWQPPAGAVAAVPAMPTAVALPTDLATRIQQLTLADVVDLALRNNPETRLAWAQSRAAAAAYGSARGAWLPTLGLNAPATRSKTVGSAVRYGGERTQFTPSLTLSYLLFDMGGRAGAVAAARENAFAAGFTHDAVLQNVMLQVEGAYFSYLATRALEQAQRATVAEAEANLAAAQQRHDVGLATIADVLQARTARSQAELALETTQGNLQATRGALATAMGLPANLPYDVAAPGDTVPIHAIGASVDSLINEALQRRPDLQAAQAAARQSAALEKEVRSQGLPALTLTGNAGRTFADLSAFRGSNYGLTLTLQFPLFRGFSHQYDVLAAQSRRDAALASAGSLRQQIIQQVFTSYYALQTAAQRVRTADDLLASARQSEDVARGRYTEGVGSILDLLTAQAALADARAQQVQARWVWSTAFSQLAHDVGVLDVHGVGPLSQNPDSLEQNPR